MKLPEAMAALELKDRQIASLVRQNEELVGEVAGLRHQLEQLQRRLYGPRSERYEAGQLYLEGVLKDSQTEEAPAERPSIPVRETVRRKARPHGRADIPEDIERVDELLDLPAEEKIDPASGKALVKLRDEISEKLAWKQGQWYVRRFIRPVYVHPDCQSERAGVFMRSMPDSPVEKCKADNSVLALVAVQKYVDHLPLYRQGDIFKREGIEVAPSTLNAWAIEPILALERLYEVLKADVLSRPVIFTDDTPVALLQNGLGRTKTARLWVYVGGCGPAHRFFDFTADRKRDRPLAVLSHYGGFVHADAYSGYDELFRRRMPEVVEVGCWAHARRRFDEARSSAVAQCAELLVRIGQLYKIEQGLKDKQPAERKAVRQSAARPLLDKLYERFEQLGAQALPASVFGKALGYALNQREALYRYTTDGRLEIDNNIAENAIRPLAIGRKNWLFAGSERGGRACAIALSLLQSAKAVGLNPYAYLHDIYNRFMGHSANRLHELLPAEWKRAHSQASGP
jgi:transposase